MGCMPKRALSERLRMGSSSEADNCEIVATADGFAGIIFMGNQKSKRRCLLSGIFRLPATRQDLLARVIPGMKLFLFDYESRMLFGIFESTSYSGSDLEPNAFLGKEPPFPAQVYFQEVAKCAPLLEGEFKSAIFENYYTPAKFSSSLTIDQVRKLIQLFQQVTLNAKKINHLSQEVYPYAIRDILERDFEEAADSKTVGLPIHDRTVDVDITARAACAVGKIPVCTYEEGFCNCRAIQTLLENEQRNNSKTVSGNDEIPSRQFRRDCSTTFMSQRGTQYAYPLSRDSARYRAEDVYGRPHNSEYPVVGHGICSKGMVLTKSFRTSSDQCRIGKDPRNTHIQAPSVDSLMHPLPFNSAHSSFRTDPLATTLEHLLFSQTKGIGATQNGMTSKHTSNVFADTNTCTSEGHVTRADLRAAIRPKLDSFHSKAISSRTGSCTHYDRAQLDGHLHLENESLNKDHQFSVSNQRPSSDANCNKLMGFPSLVSRLPVYDLEGPNFARGWRAQLMNIECDGRVHPCGGHSFSELADLGSWDSVVLRGSEETNESNTCKNRCGHCRIRDFDASLLGYNLDRVQNLLTPEDAKIFGSDSLAHSSMPSNPCAAHNSQSLDDPDIKKVYNLVEALMLQKNPKDHLGVEPLGASLTSETFKTPSKEAYPARGGSGSSDDGDHAIAWDRTVKKHRESVWSRLSVTKTHEVDQIYHVAEKRITGVHPFCNSGIVKYNRRKRAGRRSHPQANTMIHTNHFTEDSFELPSEGAVRVNFKRRKPHIATLKEEASSMKIPVLQGISQLEKDKQISRQFTAQNLPNTAHRNVRKLIRPEIQDMNEGQVAKGARVI